MLEISLVILMVLILHIHVDLLTRRLVITTCICELLLLLSGLILLKVGLLNLVQRHLIRRIVILVVQLDLLPSVVVNILGGLQTSETDISKI